MPLILGQDHRVRGQLPQRTSHGGPAQRCLRITFGHEARTSPLGQPLAAAPPGAAGSAPTQRSGQAGNGPGFGLSQQGAEPPRHLSGAAGAPDSKAVRQAIHPFDDESLDPAPDSPGIVADQLSDRDGGIPGGGEQDHEGPDRCPPAADLFFELAAFDCRDVGKAGAGTRTGTGLLVVVGVIIDQATSYPDPCRPPSPTGLWTELLSTCLAHSRPAPI